MDAYNTSALIILAGLFLACCSSAQSVTGVQSLLDAAEEANRHQGQAIVITLSPGIYQLTQAVNFSNPNVSMLGSKDGDVTLACTDGLGTAVSFEPVPGNSSGGAHFSMSDVTLSGCTDTALRAVFPSSLTSPSSMHLTDMAFTNNSGWEAGGLSVISGNTTSMDITMASCSFNSNRVEVDGRYAYAAGAALLSLSSSPSSAVVSVLNCSFDGNSGPDAYSMANFSDVTISSALAVICLGGGAPDAQQGAGSCGLTMAGSRFSGNTGTSAALLLVAESALLPHDFTASLEQTEFYGNTGFLGGGAIGLINLTSCSMYNCSLSSNTAGIADEVCKPLHLPRARSRLLRHPKTLICMHCCFEFHFFLLTPCQQHQGTADGGAILCRDTADLTIDNCSFSNNTAWTGRGGAVYMGTADAESSTGPLTLNSYDSVFSANAAYNGGALYTDGVAR